MNIFFPGEQDIYLENGICPPFLFYIICKKNSAHFNPFPPPPTIET